ncbi:putative cytochrome P450 oxidoreductase [Sodiomyces alkalinus F11]|uniref:Putative cytochrome P450 oxidoreductase n=1 Tax=Sodiomyces alkalinus (strain CBS 110278 / VKM F-3762 / F11) TaxID=1314773 RepID=A0A3N2Q811_SODAK|nr:putative cytochrome P450 oxidoreductase [Sodiomyces alkalinus F11]ROT42880.1 putative cytochrome P450 oxidoreductase [Sodiomyces alkalinus F11]
MVASSFLSNLAAASPSYETISQVTDGHTSLLAAVVLCATAHATWWFLRFSLLPSFHRDEPKELPYTLPLLGHLFSFFGDSNALLTRARNYFGDTREPFALTIAGMKTYVLTRAEDVAEAYRNVKTLSYEEFVQAMMRILGNSELSVKAMFTPLPKDKSGFPNPHGKSLGILFREMHIHQLFPGKHLDFLEDRFHEYFDEHLHLEKLNEGCHYALEKTAGSIVVPLTQWCSDYFVRGGQHAYFGPRLADIDTGLTDAFIVFDELSYQVIYQYPSFLAKEMRTSRDRILQGFRKYLQVPKEERVGDAWFVKAMEDELRAVGMNDEDMAIATLTIYWAINTNSRKASYWLLAYLLQTPGLIDIARKETAPAFRPDGTVDLDYLHSSLPQVDAMWSEMLRMSAFAASVRFITDDTVIGGKTLKKDKRLIIPYRQLHMDQRVFGEDIDQFRHERFLENPRLASGNNFRPFGGGATMCPGRHIAKRGVIVFVAMVLNRFDIELDGEDQPMLEADLKKPVPGLMSPKVGADLRVRLTPRKAST